MHVRAALLVALVGCAEPDPNDWQVTVFRSTSAGAIEPGVEVPAIASYESCTGDFDGDGAVDLALGGRQRAQLLLAQAGTLVAQTPFAIPHESSNYSAGAIICGDLDEDGNVDVVIAGSEPETATIKTFLGDGHGGLVPGPEASDSLIPLVATDVNHDGHLDLVSASSEIVTELGHGDGTFGPPVNTPVGIFAYAFDLADFDGDGQLDIALTSFPASLLGTGTSVSVLRGRSDGTFGDEQNYEAGGGTWDVVIARLDADASPDVAVTTEQDGIRILHGDGHGAFGDASDLVPLTKGGSSGEWLAAHDFDNDGRLDVVAVSGRRAAIFHSDDGESFSPASVQDSPRRTRGVSLLDVDGDGLMDVISFDNPGLGSVTRER